MFRALVAIGAAFAATPALSDTRRMQTVRLHALDPQIAGRSLVSQNLVNLPGGSYLANINGHPRNIAVTSGQPLHIIGKSFDQRRRRGYVALFMPGASTGAFLPVTSWSDTVIVVTVPIGNANLRATDNARLTVQPVRTNGIMLSMAVPNIRFEP